MKTAILATFMAFGTIQLIQALLSIIQLVMSYVFLIELSNFDCLRHLLHLGTILINFGTTRCLFF